MGGGGWQGLELAVGPAVFWATSRSFETNPRTSGETKKMSSLEEARLPGSCSTGSYFSGPAWPAVSQILGTALRDAFLALVYTRPRASFHMFRQLLGLVQACQDGYRVGVALGSGLTNKPPHNQKPRSEMNPLITASGSTRLDLHDS